MDDIRLSMRDILLLVDQQYGYAQDPEIKELMQEQEVPEKNMHLVDRRTMLKYFDYYAKRKEAKNVSDVIRMNESSTKGTKYSEKDIRKFLNDPFIQSKIKKQLERKTVDMPLGIIPKCIYNAYINQFIEESNIEAYTGYTAYQLKLLSVPDELLIGRKEEIQQQIQKLQSELEDIENELITRGY